MKSETSDSQIVNLFRSIPYHVFLDTLSILSKLCIAFKSLSYENI